MAVDELEAFHRAWELQAKNVVSVLQSLPAGGYDFRPDGGGRSLGELAWHLAEIDAYCSTIVETGRFDPSVKIPNLERPRTIEPLAAGFERVHADAVARLGGLKAADLDRQVAFFGDRPMPIRMVLWGATVNHSIHHLGQLVLMTRLAGGTPPGLYGPNREASAAMRAAAAAQRG